MFSASCSDRSVDWSVLLHMMTFSIRHHRFLTSKTCYFAAFSSYFAATLRYLRYAHGAAELPYTCVSPVLGGRLRTKHPSAPQSTPSATPRGYFATPRGTS